MPEYNRYYLKDYKNKDYKKIENIIKNLNIPFIDINTKIFLKESNPLNFFPFALPEGHYTKQGFAKVAEVVDTFVKEY